LQIQGDFVPSAFKQGVPCPTLFCRVSRREHRGKEESWEERREGRRKAGRQDLQSPERVP
jgi:hypothetical protein